MAWSRPGNKKLILGEGLYMNTKKMKELLKNFLKMILIMFFGVAVILLRIYMHRHNWFAHGSN
jgi:hypothetical protein